MLSGACHDCGEEYKDLRKHWSLSSTCEEDPERSAEVTIPCDNCGDEHTEWRYRVEKNNHSFCSPGCRNEGIKTGEAVKCAWCGDEVYKPDCHLGDMGDYDIDHHFCDKENCERKFKQHNWVGGGHPSWEGGKGGIDSVRHLLSDVSWQQTAREARNKDGHVCQMCGEFGVTRSLDVHHIIPVSSGGTNDQENLITLCMGCHRKAEEYTKKFTEPHLIKPAL